MNALFHGLLKLISLLTGALCCVGGAYLCYLQSKEYGWFLLAGLVLIIATMVWCDSSEKNHK